MGFDDNSDYYTIKYICEVKRDKHFTLKKDVTSCVIKKITDAEVIALNSLFEFGNPVARSPGRMARDGLLLKEYV